MSFINIPTLFFSWSGRINRMKFWLASLILLAVWGTLELTARILLRGGDIPQGAVLPVVIAFWLPQVLLIIPMTALGVQRLHDRAKHGWWLVLFFVVPWAIHAAHAHVALSMASLGLSVWALIEMGCLRGTIGPNQYGDDLLALQTRSIVVKH